MRRVENNQLRLHSRRGEEWLGVFERAIVHSLQEGNNSLAIRANVCSQQHLHLRSESHGTLSIRDRSLRSCDSSSRFIDKNTTELKDSLGSPDSLVCVSLNDSTCLSFIWSGGGRDSYNQLLSSRVEKRQQCIDSDVFLHRRGELALRKRWARQHICQKSTCALADHQG